MGSWGVGIFADDLAADVRADFRELVGDGLSATEAVDRLMGEYASFVNDPEEGPVFWLAMADSQWKLGRLEERTLQNALRVIDTGQDLRRWDALKDRERREAILRKLRAQLLSPPPEPKRVPRVVREANDWAVGQVIGLRLPSQRWTLMRVIGHHTDKGDGSPSVNSWSGLASRCQSRSEPWHYRSVAKPSRGAPRNSFSRSRGTRRSRPALFGPACIPGQCNSQEATARLCGQSLTAPCEKSMDLSRPSAR